MFCSNCGVDCRDANFCPDCGQKITKAEPPQRVVQRPPCHQDCKAQAHSLKCYNRHADLPPNLCFTDIADAKSFDWEGLVKTLDDKITECMKLENRVSFLYTRNDSMRERNPQLDNQLDVLSTLMHKLNADIPLMVFASETVARFAGQ